MAVLPQHVPISLLHVDLTRSGYSIILDQRMGYLRVWPELPNVLTLFEVPISRQDQRLGDLFLRRCGALFFAHP